MIYYYLWVFAPLLFRVFFRSHHVHGVKNVPRKGPILFAVNHPNSFVDAIVIGGILKQWRFWTLVRGDVFDSSWKRALLRQVFLLPIFRKTEGGRENMAKNDATFEICHGLFKKRQNVLIFAEGISRIEKRMRPLGKGTARVAIGAEEAEDFSMELTIVPVGVNYTAPGTLRQDVMVGFGKPIKLADYKSLFKENKAKAVNQLTAEIKAGMEANIVIIKDPSHDDLVEKAFEAARPEMGHSKWRYRFKSSREKIDLEKQVCAAVQQAAEDQDQFAKLSTQIEDYSNALQAAGGSSDALSDKVKVSLGIGLVHSVLAILGFFGYWLNYPTYAFARNFADKKIRKKEFYDSVFVGLWMVTTTLVYYPILGLIFWLAGLPAWSAFSVVVLGFFYSFSKRSQELVRIKRQRAKMVKSGVFEELKTKREALVKVLLG